MKNPIDVQEQEPGIYRVTYFNSEAGWINKTRLKKNDEETYRAMTVHGLISYCPSIDSAKLFIVENYY
jgi:hypothetical protein|tara:strand:+ start:3404 stop:3607 length:204 start_codon:yes stop_codon:yes gene_type:complete